MIQLFRVLIPSWRFFDGNVNAATLWYRTDASEWIPCIAKTGARSWKNLFLNSRENYLFASHALVEHLKDDIEDQCDTTVSLELVQNLIRFEIKAQQKNQLPSYFQFKLTISESQTEIYQSPVHPFKDHS